MDHANKRIFEPGAHPRAGITTFCAGLPRANRALPGPDSSMRRHPCFFFLNLVRRPGLRVSQRTNATPLRRFISALLLSAVRSLSSGATLSSPDGSLNRARQQLQLIHTPQSIDQELVRLDGDCTRATALLRVLGAMPVAATKSTNTPRRGGIWTRVGRIAQSSTSLHENDARHSQLAGAQVTLDIPECFEGDAFARPGILGARAPGEWSCGCAGPPESWACRDVKSGERVHAKFNSCSWLAVVCGNICALAGPQSEGNRSKRPQFLARQVKYCLSMHP
jgi:hypothetical protein